MAAILAQGMACFGEGDLNKPVYTGGVFVQFLGIYIFSELGSEKLRLLGAYLMDGRQAWLVHVLSPELDSFPIPPRPMRNFSRCQSCIHTPSVMLSVVVLTLIRVVGSPLQGHPTSLSPSPHTQTIRLSRGDCFLWKSVMWSPRGVSSALSYSFSSSEDQYWGGHFLALYLCLTGNEIGK